jgi:hypothetical protein
MGFTEFLLIFLLLAFSAPVVLVVCQAAGALIDEARGTTPCAPSRRANITASQPQPRRRMVQPVPPPFTFDTRPRLVPAVPPPAVVVPMAVPDLAPIAVENWPIRQTVEQPEAVPVAFNRTAARFAALEL